MISSAQGGKFAAGFAAGAFGKAVTLGLDAAGVYGKDSVLGQAKDGNLLKMAGRMTIAALAGGAGSALSGGSFANGAVTAAMQHLFNSESWDDMVSGTAPDGGPVCYGKLFAGMTKREQGCL